MTVVGHTIFGLSIGTIALSQSLNKPQKTGLYLLFALAAFAPDFKFPHWGHYKYYFSHSIFVNLAVIALLLAGWLVFAKLSKRKYNLPIALGLACAWLSHLALDSTYNHDLGIKIFWPLSDASLNIITVPWLATMNPSLPTWNWYNIRVFFIEIITFTPILLLTAAIRRQVIDTNKSQKTPAC